MLFDRCGICDKTNTHPKEEIIVVATFPQNVFAKEALAAIEKAHIIPFWQTLLTKEEIMQRGKGKLMEVPTVICMLHGIKDIVRVQTLYAESIFQECKMLTFDTLSQKGWQRYQQLLA